MESRRSHTNCMYVEKRSTYMQFTVIANSFLAHMFADPDDPGDLAV